MSAIAGLSSLASLGAGSTEASGSSTGSGKAEGTKGADGEKSLLDKLKSMSPEELEKMIKMLADVLLKMMPIEGGKGADDIGARPPQPQQAASGGCSAGGGGGGCSRGGSSAGPSQGTDGQGLGRTGDADTGGKKPWDDFSQTSEGNCVSVAVLKAGMDKYGDKMFNSKQPDGNGGFNLELQNGKKVNVSSQELAEAKREAKFKGDPNSKGYQDAIVGYAAIGKGKAEATGQSYSAAVKSLGGGEFVPNVAHYLGMKVNSISASQASTTDAAIKTDQGHALAVDNGQTDVFGRKTAFGADGFNRGNLSYFDLA